MTRTIELGWGAVDVVPEYIPQDRDVDAQLCDAYLAADTREARQAVTRELARRRWYAIAPPADAPGLTAGERIAAQIRERMAADGEW